MSKVTLQPRIALLYSPIPLPVQHSSLLSMRFSLKKERDKERDKEKQKEKQNILTDETVDSSPLQRKTPLSNVDDTPDQDQHQLPQLVIKPIPNASTATPTKDDYTAVPPGVFGIALLRGMKEAGDDKSND